MNPEAGIPDNVARKNKERIARETLAHGRRVYLDAHHVKTFRSNVATKLFLRRRTRLPLALWYAWRWYLGIRSDVRLAELFCGRQNIDLRHERKWRRKTLAEFWSGNAIALSPFVGNATVRLPWGIGPAVGMLMTELLSVLRIMEVFPSIVRLPVQIVIAYSVGCIWMEWTLLPGVYEMSPSIG